MTLLWRGFCVLVSLASLVYFAGWLANRYTPSSIDSGLQTVRSEALLTNLALLSLFALQPSGMARRIIRERFGRPSFLLATALVLFVLFVIFVAWRVWVFVKQFALPKLNEKPLEELAKIARSSLHDLSQGGDTTDVIMKCYFRMSSVVSDKRHLQRKDSMTPSEFAARLEQAGLPGDAVRRLTSLFENVRYGGRRSGQQEVNEAVACLTSILSYCGESV